MFIERNHHDYHGENESLFATSVHVCYTDGFSIWARIRKYNYIFEQFNFGIGDLQMPIVADWDKLFAWICIAFEVVKRKCFRNRVNRVLFSVSSQPPKLNELSKWREINKKNLNWGKLYRSAATAIAITLACIQRQEYSQSLLGAHKTIGWSSCKVLVLSSLIIWHMCSLCSAAA